MSSFQGFLSTDLGLEKNFLFMEVASFQGFSLEELHCMIILSSSVTSHQGSESSGPLFRLAAVLLHEGLVSLDDLYPHVRGILINGDIITTSSSYFPRTVVECERLFAEGVLR